jgi:predicted AAA+ superfamily ATPase
VETLAQGCIRGPNILVHFFRELENPKNRRSPIREVDFIAERPDGFVLPIEVKFRRRIDEADLAGLRFFGQEFDAAAPMVVTRETYRYDTKSKTLVLPLESFLLAF